MAADERLMALKKAYADIILNTAKEAATRIMASEKKAQRFQRELQAGKDEALRMLLRLKQMMDVKIADAELMSLSQQKKIDELEAQLQEAEDIVKDLREELSEVQSELEQLRNKQQHPIEQQVLSHKGLPEQNKSQHNEYLGAFDLRNNHQFQAHESLKFYCAAPYTGNVHLGFQDLPSIILRSKEPELYRNGCTQRIRASEGNLLNRELSVSRKKSKDRDEISVRDDIDDGEIISEHTSTMENMDKVMKKEVHNQLGSLHLIPSFHTTKKRGTRHRKKNFLSSINTPAPGISYITTDPSSARSNPDFQENSFSGLRLAMDNAESNSGRGDANPSSNHSELGESVGVNKSAVIVEEKVVPVMLETSKTISLVAAGETNIKKADSLLPISKLNESAVANELHNVGERVIKYTFQRKRKRESLCVLDGDVSPHKDGSKGQMPEKQSDPVDREKSDLKIELSQDS
ncbi:OLC1v1012931C1 [Oldenlandia corymbosa var. corymbosa]|uniref:OLC1v1012931C1 n=1 Tax=Oldenlandia corymbosa var. corymbosa TaxID=529605 RepID=A0AAV1DXA9_OLDCO|nr:OLC1v1012931C1 [Oldenlandia corymbosa var. corymbosa]